MAIQPGVYEKEPEHAAKQIDVFRNKIVPIIGMADRVVSDDIALDHATIRMLSWLAAKGIEACLSPIGKGYFLEWKIRRFVVDEDGEWVFDSYLTHNGWSRLIPGSLTFPYLFDALAHAVLNADALTLPR